MIERERKKETGECETYTNYKIACCVLCLFCLGFVVFSVCLSSTKEIEIEREKGRVRGRKNVKLLQIIRQQFLYLGFVMFYFSFIFGLLYLVFV